MVACNDYITKIITVNVFDADVQPIQGASVRIYNDTATGDPACAVLSFGGDQQVSSGDFQIQFPAPVAATAIIRID